eukprot:COSAG02_NODE_17379_length_1008_cov_1.308031_1_plen_165_part_00
MLLLRSRSRRNAHRASASVAYAPCSASRREHDRTPPSSASTSRARIVACRRCLRPRGDLLRCHAHSIIAAALSGGAAPPAAPPATPAVRWAGIDCRHAHKVGVCPKILLLVALSRLSLATRDWFLPSHEEDQKLLPGSTNYQRAKRRGHAWLSSVFTVNYTCKV